MGTKLYVDTSGVPGDAAMAARSTGRILAIDYGRKRIGVALSDEAGLTAQPLTTILRSNRQADVRRIREMCRTHGVRRIIVGQPLHMSGQAGDMAAEAARYATRLQRELGVTVELADERLTSWEAKEIVSETGRPSRKRSEPLDAIAAAVLLRDYLELKRGLAGVAPAEKS